MVFHTLVGPYDTRIQSGLLPARTFCVDDVSRRPNEVLPPKRAVLLVLPSASRALRALDPSKRQLFGSLACKARMAGTVIFTFFCREPTPDGRYVGMAYPITTASTIGVVPGPPDSSPLKAAIPSLSRYLRRHAFGVMDIHDWRQFLPIGPLDNAVAVRTPFLEGCPEIELPANILSLGSDDHADLMSVAKYFQDAACRPPAGAWQGRLHLYIDGENVGCISCDESHLLFEQPLRCIRATVDAVGLRVIRRSSSGDIVAIKLDLGEMAAVIDLFLHPGIPFSYQDEVVQALWKHGQPYNFRSKQSHRKRRNSAKREINKHGELIVRARIAGQGAHLVQRNRRPVMVVLPAHPEADLSLEESWEPEIPGPAGEHNLAVELRL